MLLNIARVVSLRVRLFASVTCSTQYVQLFVFVDF